MNLRPNSRKTLLVVGLTLLFFLSSAAGTGVLAAQSTETSSREWLSKAGTPQGLRALKTAVAAAEEEYRRELKVKGIYVPGNLVPTSAFPRLIELVETTELNAVVIDVKSDEGYIYYDSELPLVEQVGSERLRIKNPRQLLQELESKGIYTIARLVVFKDLELGKAKPEWAVQYPGGQPWHDRTGQIWMNPYIRQVWDYNIDVACEAASLGFDEVQFDYVRFPSDGSVSAARYPQRDERHESVVIAQFLSEARERLSLHGAYASADIFGQVPSVAFDMGIGQQWELLAGTVDYLSPMAYPSHYGPGVYGLPDPDAQPHATVFHTMQDAHAKFDSLLSEGIPQKLVGRVKEVPDELRVSSSDQVAVVRPWLQDFSLRHRYGPAQVRGQIEAVYEAGGEQWLLWNPSGLYTKGALHKAEEKD